MSHFIIIETLITISVSKSKIFNNSCIYWYRLIQFRCLGIFRTWSNKETTISLDLSNKFNAILPFDLASYFQTFHLFAQTYKFVNFLGIQYLVFQLIHNRTMVKHFQFIFNQKVMLLAHFYLDKQIAHPLKTYAVV